MKVDAIDRIIELAKPEYKEIEGRMYSTRKLHPNKATAVKPLYINTLSGLIQYVKQNADDLDLKKTFVCVEDEKTVHLYTGLSEDWREREHLIEVSAKIYLSDFDFNCYMAPDQFIVALQSEFKESATRAKILKVVGNIKGEEVNELTDDGVTQKVSQKAGVHLAGSDAAIPNPVKLIPYRTFGEIDQPEANFVLRVKRSRNDNPPQCALFEADGNFWKVLAIQNIQKFINKGVPELTIIA